MSQTTKSKPIPTTTSIKDDPRYQKPLKADGAMHFLPSKEPTASEIIAAKVQAAQRPRSKTCQHIWQRQNDGSCKCVYCPAVRTVVDGKVEVK